MARVEVTERALADFERLFYSAAAEDAARAPTQLLSVWSALELIAEHPLLGREAEEGRRELVLFRGRDGYVVKYRWLPADDVVLVLAASRQQEVGYSED